MFPVPHSMEICNLAMGVEYDFLRGSFLQE
jgi:hypothetical protein